MSTLGHPGNFTWAFNGSPESRYGPYRLVRRVFQPAPKILTDLPLGPVARL